MLLEIFIIQEWEVYVLSKLQWNPPTVVATDLLEDILKRLSKHRPQLCVERKNHIPHFLDSGPYFLQKARQSRTLAV